jgi:pyrroloquinoline quinone (PQQ) biosynthesis protein C
MINITPHSKWVENFLDYLQPYQQRILSTGIFDAVSRKRVTKSLSKGATIDFYPLIESFPQYLALNLTKVPAGNSEWNNKTRDWLIINIHQERLHAKWWRKMALRFGVSADDLNAASPSAEVDAINNYLWRICTYGSLPEAISAANFAVEGATGEWTKRVSEGLRRHPHIEDIDLREQDLEWINAHATYDDKHPAEALEIIKAFATTEEDQEKVKQAAKRALEYYALALDACYELHR